MTWGHELNEMVPPPRGWRRKKMDSFHIPYSYHTVDDEYRKSHAWSGVMASTLGCDELVNDAEPGSSNDRIMRTTMDWVIKNHKKGDDLLVVIGWSGFFRVELYDTWQNMYVNLSPLQSNEYTNSEEDKFAKSFFYKTVGDEAVVNKFLHQVLYMQSFLDSKGVKYIFSNAIMTVPQMVEPYQHFSHLLNEVKPNFMGFNDETFGGFVHENDYPIAPEGHPLEDAHRDWGLKLTEHYKVIYGQE